jgi:hypothetical protein
MITSNMTACRQRTVLVVKHGELLTDDCDSGRQLRIAEP